MIARYSWYYFFSLTCDSEYMYIHLLALEKVMDSKISSQKECNYFIVTASHYQIEYCINCIHRYILPQMNYELSLPYSCFDVGFIVRYI